MERKVNLMLGELRRTHGITQQQLADIVGTSYQNISKWENGVTMPDITILPVLADYFQISVDVLLGLVPLTGSEYKEENTDSEDFWNKKLTYLVSKQKINWNQDYFTFLVRDVWKIQKPINVLDLGCGYGYMGLMLLDNLPEGSTYTGVDFSIKLLQYGERLFKQKGMAAEWKEKNILDYSANKKYDMVVCQSVLRHLGDSAPIISKMKECTVDNGWIVCIDSNRELELDGLYIDGFPYEKLCERNGARKHWLSEYENGDRDYAAAMRNAYQMRKQGIRNIEIRMNDKVEFVCPEQEAYREKVDYFKYFYSTWYDEPEEMLMKLMNHGMTKCEAKQYISRGSEICDYLDKNRDTISYSWFRGKTITFGRK